MTRHSLKTTYIDSLKMRLKVSLAFTFTTYNYINYASSNLTQGAVPVTKLITPHTDSHKPIDFFIELVCNQVERKKDTLYSFKTYLRQITAVKKNLSQLVKIYHMASIKNTKKRKRWTSRSRKYHTTKRVRRSTINSIYDTTCLLLSLNQKPKVRVTTKYMLLSCIPTYKRGKNFQFLPRIGPDRFFNTKHKCFQKSFITLLNLSKYLTKTTWKPLVAEIETLASIYMEETPQIPTPSPERLQCLQRQVMHGQELQVSTPYHFTIPSLYTPFNFLKQVTQRNSINCSGHFTTELVKLFSTKQLYPEMFKSHLTLPSILTHRKSLKITHIFSYHGLPFISQANNFHTYNRFKYKTNFTFAYKIWKSFYSFLKTNELKKYTYDNVRLLLFKQLQKHLVYSHRLFKSTVTKHSSFSFFYSLYRLNAYEHSSTFLTDQIYWRHNEIAPTLNFPCPDQETYTELHIPRVKFKPGYMRLWRHFRLAFAESVNFKYIYQQQLTRYISRFSRKTHQHYFQFFENKVTAMFIYSRLVPDEPTFNTFMSSKLLYLNHVVLTTTSTYIYPTDFLQVIISNWYYIFLRWLLSCLHLRYKKFSNLVFRKSATTRYKSIKRTKQKSFYTPNWIYLVKYDYTIIKSFFEVDFFTLSCYCLYDPFRFSHYSPKDFKVLRAPILRLYNWKYIN